MGSGFIIIIRSNRGTVLMHMGSGLQIQDLNNNYLAIILNLET